MTRLPINISAGFVSDVTEWATPGTVKTGDKIRFKDGHVQVHNGWESISNDYLSGVTRKILPYKDNTGSQSIVFGTHSNLLLWRGDVIYDITPNDYVVGAIDGAVGPGYGIGTYGSGPYGTYTDIGRYYPTTWALDNFGEDVVANPRGGPIYLFQNDPTQSAQRLDEIFTANTNHIPTSVNYSITAPNDIRQIIAFGCNQELDPNTGSYPGPFDALCIRGSDIDADIGVWNIDSSENAFQSVISDGGGAIIAARKVSSQIAFWTETKMFMGTYVGNPGVPWQWDAVDGAPGMIGPNAHYSTGQSVFWITPDKQLWTYNVGGSPQQIQCPIRIDTIANIADSQGDKVNITFIPAFNEIRIDYPDNRDLEGSNIENSRYLTYCLNDNTFSSGIQDRTAFCSGAPFQWPISVTSGNVDIPYRGSITDNASAANALSIIQNALPTYSGVNTVTRANANVVTGPATITDLFGGKSGWGFRFHGDGTSHMKVKVTGLDIVANTRVSVSYTAQVVVGPVYNASVEVYHGSSPAGDDYISNVAIPQVPTLIKHENLKVTATDDYLVFQVTDTGNAVANNNIIEITDIKVEQHGTATRWTPSPNDTGLYANYGEFIATLPYPQLVGSFYYQEKNNTDETGQYFPWEYETNDFALDADQTGFMVTRFIPDFRYQVNPVYLTLYMSDYPQDPNERMVGPFEILPGQKKVDFRATGKIARFKVTGTGPFMMGQCLFDAVQRGTR